jgi:hypothetical protein
MFWRRERERDLEREIRGDLELEAAERPSSGMSPENAQFAARRQSGIHSKEDSLSIAALDGCILVGIPASREGASRRMV